MFHTMRKCGARKHMMQISHGTTHGCTSKIERYCVWTFTAASDWFHIFAPQVFLFSINCKLYSQCYLLILTVDFLVNNLVRMCFNVKNYLLTYVLHSYFTCTHCMYTLSESSNYDNNKKYDTIIITTLQVKSLITVGIYFYIKEGSSNQIRSSGRFQHAESVTYYLQHRQSSVA